MLYVCTVRLSRLLGTVCGFTTGYPDLIYFCYNDVRCCTTHEYVFVYPCDALLQLCVCDVAVAAVAVLRLAAAVRHIVCRVTPFVAVNYCI